MGQNSPKISQRIVLFFTGYVAYKEDVSILHSAELNVFFFMLVKSNSNG